MDHRAVTVLESRARSIVQSHLDPADQHEFPWSETRAPASVDGMRGSTARTLPLLLLPLVASGCADEGGQGTGTSATSGIPLPTASAEGSGTDNADGPEDTGDKLDVMQATGEAPCAEGGDCGDECVPSEHVPCDEGADNMISALGLNCPGDATVEVTTSGNPGAMAVRTGFGSTNEWAPREGSAFAVIGSGLVSDLDLATPPGDSNQLPTHCNDELGAQYAVGATLPDPLRVNDVGGDCTEDPTLLGSGDCSNTIQGQFSQGGSAFDYTEVRIVAEVPMTNNSVNYDFAFFSTEYPYYYGDVYNDMYVGWLESESWTGNISFDEQGNPISLNAGFLDFQDTMELAGTCMQQHAGTRWLQSVAPVSPGETITLVLAIFDMADPILDSYVFLDNFGWGCEGTDKPTTTPVG